MRPHLPELPAQALAFPWWRYRLPEALEAQFRTETDADRNRQLRFWTGVCLASNFVLLGFDLWSMPELWRLCLLLRLGIAVPVAAWAWHAFGGPRPRWQESLASVLPAVTNVFATLALFALSADFDFPRSVLVLALSVTWLGAPVPLRIPDAALFVTLTLVLGGAADLVGMTAHDAPFVHPHVVLICLVVVALSLFGRVVAERQARQRFLQGLGLRSEAELLARSNARLQRMLSTDQLTGLANRRAFDEALAEAWRQGATAPAPVAAMMIDIDHFKLFNDSAGHQEGDRNIVAVAGAIAQNIRHGSDLAARYGGEEFVVLMLGTTEAEARVMAERVRTGVEALQMLHPGFRDTRRLVTVSVGVAAADPAAPGATPAGLLAAADDALYAAKRAGRDRVVAAGQLARGRTG